MPTVNANANANDGADAVDEVMDTVEQPSAHASSSSSSARAVNRYEDNTLTALPSIAQSMLRCAMLALIHTSLCCCDVSHP